VYTGRQGLLVEFRFTPDGWVEIVKEKRAENNIVAPAIADDFKDRSLSDNWQWSVFQNVDKKIKRGRLQLTAMPTSTGAFIGQKTYSGNYKTTTVINTKKSTAAVGLGVIGDEKNTVAILLSKGKIEVVQVKDDKITTSSTRAIVLKKKVHLQMQVRNGKDLFFFYSKDGKNFDALNDKPIDGSFLPPWDRAVRAGLIAKGSNNQKAVFEEFEMQNQ
jgi:hypothetical protein